MVNNHPLAYQTRIRQALCTTTLPFAYVHNEKARLLDVVSALLIYMYAKKDSGSIPPNVSRSQTNDPEKPPKAIFSQFWPFS